MGVRAYGRETLASLPIDVDKNWNDRSISNVNSLQANEHITITARGANRKLYPSFNRYDSETDGWYVSKDNNDIERKFWKDDFSVDSSSQYTGDEGSFTWDTANSRLASAISPPFREIARKAPGAKKVSVVMSLDEVTATARYGYLSLQAGSHYIQVSASASTAASSTRCTVSVGGYYIHDVSIPSSIDTTDTRIEIQINPTSVVFYRNGAVISTYNGVFPYEIESVKLERYSSVTSGTIYFKDFTASPSISYADDFATDTVSMVRTS